jgi:hypothetical protein
MNLVARLAKLESDAGTSPPRIIVAASQDETIEQARERTGAVGDFLLVHTGVPRPGR